ncbi:MAG: LysR family transcriptional regulator [Alicyclobacillus herbarius]|uniref:LysR family transcriptional regulator n=1 Tax=Alicyclobacillus herbarius TaxID=122960 RepID=UPI0023532C10|nr:LysR family transcriptional regulator [Alicyclobacillus herbarius]MCL6631872.1 LysR family transcriptional regulator [Alicyclobacillus herbarius]
MDTWLRTLVTVVESSTLVQAAESLHLTQPTVTRQLQQLEQQLGVRLFDRLGKRLVLNRAGEVVYHYAKSQQSLYDKMQAELGALADPYVGTVYLGAGLTPSIYLLPPLLAEYRRRHPQVRFQVTSGSSKEIAAALERREIDFGVVTTVDEGMTDFWTIPLLRDELLLVAAPGHPLAERGAASAAEWMQEPLVLMRKGSGLRRILDNLATEHGLTLQVAMETDSLESINRLVQLGVGLSCLPRSCVQDDIAAGRLAAIRTLDGELGARTITLIGRREGTLSACAGRFIRVLSEWWKSDAH